MEKKIESIIRQFEAAKSYRQLWEHQWQEISDYILPRRGDFNRKTTEGAKRATQLLDSTGLNACESLASSLQGLMTSPSERWFSLSSTDPMLMNRSEVRGYFQALEKVLYSNFSNPKTRFYPQCHELYMDLGGFGHGVFNIEEDIKNDSIIYRTFQLGECYAQQNELGIIDTLYRVFEYTPLQVLTSFKDSKQIPQEYVQKLTELYQKTPNTKIEILHAVYPRNEYELFKDKSALAYASCYIACADRIILSEGGYDSFPYCVPRWYTMGGEVYGRSPGMTALPEIKTLNEVRKTMLKARHKAVDPPVIVSDDGFMSQFDMRPGRINFARVNAQGSVDGMYSPIQSSARLEEGEYEKQYCKQQILQIFFADILQESKNVEMTRTEVLQREEARMRLMAPHLGRLHSEFIQPMIVRTFKILEKQKKLPDLPEILKGTKIDLQYVSPLARAQKRLQAAYAQEFFNGVTQMAQINPEMLDRIHPDRTIDWLAELHAAPVTILRTDKELETLKAERKEQQESAQQMMMAEQGTKAMSNLQGLMQGPKK